MSCGDKTPLTPSRDNMNHSRSACHTCSWYYKKVHFWNFLMKPIIISIFLKLLVNTLKEHHQFQTKPTISIISNILKSMGGFFQEFFPWIIFKYHRHLSIHLENYYIVWKVYVLWSFAKYYFKLTLQGIKEHKNLVWPHLLYQSVISDTPNVTVAKALLTPYQKFLKKI